MDGCKLRTWLMELCIQILCYFCKWVYIIGIFQNSYG
jgi:hypothetical protein